MDIYLFVPLKANWQRIWINQHIDNLVQDCNISIANAPEILQFSTKPSIYPDIYISSEFGKSSVNRVLAP